MPWESLEHTSDLALLIRAQSEEELLAEAAGAVLAQIVEPKSVDGKTRKTVKVCAESPEERFLDWLREIVFLAATRGFLASAVLHMELSSGDGIYGLEAELSGEMIDTSRHLLLHEVKTVTYQDFFYGKTKSSWQARVVLDV
ncbi:hypothetical protein GF359_06915 [candidate division WOR-3 bacterium]|uniref:Archease domain-containing protein n=1 Tax=candidate division WOR-3 bacterium TaxID=2052148 RepID=A0A9D5KA30_UNCW3|nr:hypothetical protein [candidate division WOR-3 bacterium]MBD3364929.1 hypothetical protein [candidate division WOR-3 bacterium]